ncbi:MAG: DMT family transporter [Pikeienuella sp.]
MLNPTQPPLIAFICMALGATGLTLGDFFIKKASLEGVSVAALLLFASPLTIVGLTLLAHFRGGIGHHLAPRAPGKLVIRAGLLLVMSWLNITSLSLNPYAQHAMLFQLSPVFVLLIGILFMGERVTAPILIAITVCLLGTWLILDPGLQGISITLLFAITAALSNAATNSFVAANRKAATPLGFTFWAVIGVLCIVLPYWAVFDQSVPGKTALIWVQLSAALAIGGIVLASLAMQLSNGSTGKVGIMLYVQMPVAILLGWLAFGEQPPNMAILGGALIVLAGASIPLLELRNRTRIRA